MITFAQLKHLKNKKFQKMHKEIAEYHQKVNYFYDWSRQWEYPWILQNVPFKKKNTVLDVGGGTCHFPSLVARRVKKVIVGEIYKERVWKSEDERKVEYLNLDIRSFKSKEKYDIVLCISVLEHIDNFLSSISNLTKLVKKKGYLAMTLDLFLDNTRKCQENQIVSIIKILKKDFEIGKIDLNKNDLYQKITLQEMKLDLPNLYSRNYPNRTSLGVIVRKK